MTDNSDCGGIEIIQRIQSQLFLPSSTSAQSSLQSLDSKQSFSNESEAEKEDTNIFKLLKEEDTEEYGDSSATIKTVNESLDESTCGMNEECE